MDIQDPPNRNRTPVVEIDVGAAYEFLMTLNVFNEQSGFEYEGETEWFDTIRKKTAPDLLQEIEQFNLSSNKSDIHGWTGLFGLAYDSPSPKDVPAFLAYLETVEPLELRLHLIGYYRRRFRKRTPLDVMLQAAEGDPEAQNQFLKTAFSDDPDLQEKYRYFFSRDLEATKTSLLDIFERWYDQVFSSQEQHVMPILERDAEAKRALKQSMTPERLVETATNGLEYVPEPGLRKLLLIPCFIERPWNETSEYQDMKIFCYPVADESVSPDSNAPPVRLVRLYKALADERRLRILKLLTVKSYSLQELADEFDIAKSTMHHHLAILRTTGLVRARLDDRLYSLRQNKLSEVSELLDTYLKGPSE